MSAFWSSPTSKPRSRGSRPARVTAVVALLAALVAVAWAWPTTFASANWQAALWGVGNAAVLWLAATWDKP